MGNSVLKEFFNKEWQEFILFHSEVVHFKSGDYLFKVGDDTHGIYLLNQGKVKVTTNGVNNTERIVRLATVNDVIGHRGFGGTWKYTVSAVALEDCVLLFIPLKIFEFAFKSNADFAYYMLIFFAEELRQSEKFASQLPIRNVIASVLYDNLKTFGYAEGSTTKLSYTLSRKDMASKAGTRYETVIRTLADFNNEKIIKIDGKSIHILDEQLLFELKEGLK